MYIYIKFRGKTCSRLQSAGNLALLITINPTITATDAIAVVVVSLLARIEFYTASPKNNESINSIHRQFIIIVRKQRISI